MAVMKPFWIGSVLVDPPVVLAPMEDVTNIAFRLLAKEIGGPGLMFTEFISANAIHYGADKSRRKMTVDERERPLGIQIFGSDPAIMAETARIAEDMGADLVDINMGCWVPKVVRLGSGAALLKEPDAAAAVVEAVAGAVKIPVTVKLRAGWDHSQLAAPELAPRFESAGAQAITLHARTARQGMGGAADWNLIADIKTRVKVPVMGNGDIRAPEDAERMLLETGCDGVMIGRAAVSNPWFLRSVAAYLGGEPLPPEPTMEERRNVALRHVRAHVEFLGDERRAVSSLRGQLTGYLKGFERAAAYRERLCRASSIAEVDAILWEAGQKSHGQNLAAKF
jgi:tRNA-dihydrouridine synthase B